ncbi:MAG: SURF1 family protein [Roseibium sp.]
MGRTKKLIIPSIAAAIGLAILLNLGFWQLGRLEWKENLIVQVEQGVAKAPVPAPVPTDWATLSDVDDYRNVSVSGEYLDGETFYYTALSKPFGKFGGPGVMAYSPFKTTDGWIVLINRGFLPQELPENERAHFLKPPEGISEITGLMRLGEKPNWTTPASNPNDRIWFARDTDAMGKTLGIEAQFLAPYSIDLDKRYTPSSGLPQAGETIVRFKNDHLGYALTWFGLAATLIGVFLAYAATILWPRKENAKDA